MAISNAFKGAYTNEISQQNQGISTITRGVKDVALASLGIANVASGGALAGKLTQFAGRSLGGGAVMSLLGQKAESAKNGKEAQSIVNNAPTEKEILNNQKSLSKKELASFLGDNPINRLAKKELMTVFDKLVQAHEEGIINKKGQIETSMGKIDASSELGKKILTEGE